MKNIFFIRTHFYPIFVFLEDSSQYLYLCILSNCFYNNFLGRAVMIGAIEKQKLVYILNRDAQARLTISSPLEAHKANTFVYHCVGVDVGFENPMFACLEVDYEEVDNDPSGIHYLKIFHMNFSFLN